MEQSKPQETFFGTRELVERLISLLDIQTTLRLAQSVVNQDILRESLGSKAWRELIKRGYGENGELEEEDVKNLVKILKILKVMELEEPSKLLLPLLDHICKLSGEDEDWSTVNLVCPCSSSPHIISTAAFLLLELVEGSLKTSLQSIQSVVCLPLEEPFLSALSTRMSRMKESVTEIIVDEIAICSIGSALAFKTLLQAQSLSVTTLYVGGAMGEEGWRVLAGALRDNPNRVELSWVDNIRPGLAEARLEDIKDIWEATEGGFRVVPVLGPASLLIQKDKFDWERVNQILAMSEDEFAAETEEQQRSLIQSESESDEEIESESEEEHDSGDGEDDLGEGNGEEDGGDGGDLEEEPA